MQIITNFPKHYQSLYKYVESVSLISNDLESKGNLDLYVRLKNGSSYGFTAFTPENARFVMENEYKKSLVTRGLILVTSMDVTSLLEAIDEIIYRTQEGNTLLDYYGRLQCE